VITRTFHRRTTVAFRRNRNRLGNSRRRSTMRPPQPVLHHLQKARSSRRIRQSRSPSFLRTGRRSTLATRSASRVRRRRRALRLQLHLRPPLQKPCPVLALPCPKTLLSIIKLKKLPCRAAISL